MDCHSHWNRKLVMKQGKMIGYFISINNQITINPNVFIKSCSLCKKQFYLQNERKTKPWFAIADLDNVKNTRTALEFMELLGGE
jgi:transcription-repair coupling factor (superfamily II helicase)